MTNKEKFKEIVNAHIKRDGIIPLMDWLETTDFYEAPASTKYHLSVEGGLLTHSLNVYNRLINQCVSVFGPIPDEAQEKLAVIALFHDLCKVDVYKKEWKNVKVDSETGSKTDAGGNFDWDVKQSYSYDDQFPFGYHGAKSAYLIGQFMRLTDEECVSITNHMGAFDRPNGNYTLNKVFERWNLALLLHIADCLATFIDEREV